MAEEETNGQMIGGRMLRGIAGDLSYKESFRKAYSKSEAVQGLGLTAKWFGLGDTATRISKYFSELFDYATSAEPTGRELPAKYGRKFDSNGYDLVKSLGAIPVDGKINGKYDGWKDFDTGRISINYRGKTHEEILSIYFHEKHERPDIPHADVQLRAWDDMYRSGFGDIAEMDVMDFRKRAGDGTEFGSYAKETLETMMRELDGYPERRLAA